MYRFSNSVIGFLNLFTLLSSIPIIGGGLWISKNNTTCASFLQTPLLVVGFVVLLISLLGFIGACFNVVWALWLYLFVMLLLITALLALTVFGFVVTSRGGGSEVDGRVYKEFHLDKYSPWLQSRIQDPRYWTKIRACILGSKSCSKLALWTPLDYLQKDMTPIQSGCCKPPTSCNYNGGATQAGQDQDCFRWSNSPEILCYDCDSCKAGVLEDVRLDWQKLSVLSVVIIGLLVCTYCIGCCAYRNTKRVETGHPHGRDRMTKVRPRWDYHWHVDIQLFHHQKFFIYCLKLNLPILQVEMAAGPKGNALLAPSLASFTVHQVFLVGRLSLLSSIIYRLALS